MIIIPQKDLTRDHSIKPLKTSEFNVYNWELSLKDEQVFENLKTFFKLNKSNKTDNELFNKSLETARKLGVKVIFSARNERSFYNLDKNLILIGKNASHYQAQDLLHELIHSTTRKGFKLFEENLDEVRKIFTNKQIIALREIKELFEKSNRMFDDLSDKDLKLWIKENYQINSGDMLENLSRADIKEAFFYGYKNTDEFIAELANPAFRDFLQTQSLWEKIKHALANFFLGNSEKDLSKTTTLQALKKRYYAILDEYDVPRVKPSQVQEVEQKGLFDDLSFAKKWENDENAETKISQAKQKLNEIDTSKLTAEQNEILRVFKGELPSANVQGKDLNDIHILESGSRKKGAKKILIKHAGIEKTGGLSNDELLNMSKIIKNGQLSSDSFELKDDFIRYAYDLKENGVNLRLVVDEFNDGKKIFDFYSDRNFQRGYKPDLPTPQSQIIPKIQEKFKFSEKKARDLQEWHKDSHAITKDDDGLPKVFYHGGQSKFEVFEGNSNYGKFFTANENIGKSFAQGHGENADIKELYTIFLKIKNPFKANELTINSYDDFVNLSQFLDLKHKPTKADYEDFLKLKDDFNEQKEYFNIDEMNKEEIHYLDDDGLYKVEYLNNGNALKEEWDALSTNEKLEFGDLDLEKALHKNPEKFFDDDTFYFILHHDMGFYNTKQLKKINLKSFDDYVRNEFDIALQILDKYADNTFTLAEYVGLIKGKRQKTLKDILQAKGYDSIIFNDYQLSVFEPNQIKAVDNRGMVINEPLKEQKLNLKPIDTNEALRLLDSLKPTDLPKELNIKDFLKSLESVENKENFIKHLQSKDDAQARLAYLNLIEPTLNEADFLIKKGERQDFIKLFNDGKDFFSLLITQDKGKTLITHLPKARKAYIKNRFKNADLIQTFTSRASESENSLNGLAKESISQNHKYFNEISPNIYHSNQHIGTGLLTGTLNAFETDEDGNTSFNPSKFVTGFIGGAAGSKVVKTALDKNPKLRKNAEKFAIMARLKAKKDNVMQYKIFKMIDESQKYGSKMKLIGKENLNADTLTYILSKNKRIAINKLDESTAKLLGFKYPSDVRRTIQPDEIVHTLNRHGEHSNLVKNSGQKAITLDDIAKYQDYADNADMKGLNYDKQHNKVLMSFKRLDNEFYIIIEQIRKTQNELAYKDMYFGRGAFDENKLGEKIK